MTSVIFMGTPEFSVPVLEGLIENNYEIKAVVTQPDKKVGRKQKITKSPAKVAAEKHNLPIYQPAKLSGSDEMQELIDMHADLIVTAAYGQFLPTKFLNSVKIAAVNVHGSLLPKYRGGAPIQYSLINGDAETGITIMKMSLKMDAGDIISTDNETLYAMEVGTLLAPKASSNELESTVDETKAVAMIIAKEKWCGVDVAVLQFL